MPTNNILYLLGEVTGCAVVHGARVQPGAWSMDWAKDWCTAQISVFHADGGCLGIFHHKPKFPPQDFVIP